MDQEKINETVWEVMDNLDTLINSEAYENDVNIYDLQIFRDCLYESYIRIRDLYRTAGLQ